MARGAHAAAMAEQGLLLRTPDGDHRVHAEVADGVSSLRLRQGDVIVLATKTQDSAAALGDVASLLIEGRPAVDVVPIVCAQNGVENERLALRYFRHVYGVYVALPATHLEPGVVVAEGAPKSGILDIGCYPAGVDATAEQIAADLSASMFDSMVRPDVMRWKYAKLLGNLANSLDAVTDRSSDGAADIAEQARAEARVALAAAGIEPMPADQVAARRGRLVDAAPVEGHKRSGSSSRQSLVRGTGSIEADYLNGEIALLGRLHGIPTPVNDALQHLAGREARLGNSPGRVPLADVRAAISEAVAARCSDDQGAGST